MENKIFIEPKELSVMPCAKNISDIMMNIQEKYIFHRMITKDLIEEISNDFKNQYKNLKTSKGISLDKPLFKHDCSGCIYLEEYFNINVVRDYGTVNVTFFELYAHFRVDRLELIARYGDEPDEYLSFTYYPNVEYSEQRELLTRTPAIYEAFKRYGEKCRPKMPRDWKFYPDETEF